MPEIVAVKTFGIVLIYPAGPVPVYSSVIVMNTS